MADGITHKLEKDEKHKTLSVQLYGNKPLIAFSSNLEISQKLIAYCNSDQIQYNADMIIKSLIFSPKIFE
ncbi:MAG: hypothetical protein ACMUEM_00105 [Flavobacteriales bacterium AspAUS03]